MRIDDRAIHSRRPATERVLLLALGAGAAVPGLHAAEFPSASRRSWSAR